MSKGAKFRLTSSISKSKLLHFVKEALIQLMGKLSKKTKLKKEVFEMWFDHIWAQIKARCKFIQESDLVSNDIFEDTSVINYLKELHSKFIIVPVDKASNNFAIICKKFYFEQSRYQCFNVGWFICVTFGIMELESQYPSIVAAST